MDRPIDRILAALQSHGCEPRRFGTGWVARCPAHDDRNPSLSIGVGSNGCGLLKCHAGCTTEDVCHTIGLSLSALFPDDTGATQHHNPNTPQQQIKTKGIGGDGPTQTFSCAEAVLRELERRYGPMSNRWDYSNAAGEHVGITYRRDRSNRQPKIIRHAWRTADGQGWLLKGGPKPHPLLYLPDILRSEQDSVVIVCEGEPATDAARLCGFTATTSAGGAQRARHTDWSPLHGRDVVVLPDANVPGERYARDVAALATAAGARSVRVVKLSDEWKAIPDGGDLCDVLQQTGGDCTGVRTQLNKLIEACPPIEIEPMIIPVLPEEFVPFPIDLLPRTVRDYVVGIADAIGCDPAFVVLPTLSMLASAIGTTCQIQLKGVWLEYPTLWIVIVAPSGSVKTPAMEAAIAPIRRAESEAHVRYELDRNAWEQARELYEGTKDSTHEKFRDVDSTPPIEPTLTRHILSDATIEAVMLRLKENPRGLLLHMDEFSGWFASLDKYRKGSQGADVGTWLSIYSGQPLTVDRKTTHPPHFRLELVSVSLTGGIQPDVLASRLTDEHFASGLVARMLLAQPPVKPKTWNDEELDASVASSMQALVDRLLDISHAIDADGRRAPNRLQMTVEAKRQWKQYYNELNASMAGLTDRERAMLAKHEALAARLALIIQVVRHAASEAPLQELPSIDEESMVAGIGIARWCSRETMRVHAMLGESHDVRRLRQLSDWIRDRGGSVRVRDLTKNLSRYRGRTDEATSDLEEMTAMGWGSWQHDQSPLGGRPTRTFQLHSNTNTPGIAPYSKGNGGDGEPKAQPDNKRVHIDSDDNGTPAAA